MWNSGGKPTTYIPYTGEARRAQMAGKLKNRIEAKHAVIVRKQVQGFQKPIDIPDDAVTIAATEM